MKRALRLLAAAASLWLAGLAGLPAVASRATPASRLAPAKDEVVLDGAHRPLALAARVPATPPVWRRSGVEHRAGVGSSGAAAIAVARPIGPPGPAGATVARRSAPRARRPRWRAYDATAPPLRTRRRG